LRKIPIDVEQALQDFILSKVNPEGLKLDTDWRLLIIPMFAESIPTIQDIRANFPNLTHDEIMRL
jgi:hypothetical protein